MSNHALIALVTTILLFQVRHCKKFLTRSSE